MSEESVKMFPSSLFCINVFLLLIHSSLQDHKINKALACKKQKIDEYVDCQSKLLEGQSGPSYIASGKDFCDNVGPRYNDYLQQGTKELEVWKIYLDKQEEHFSQMTSVDNQKRCKKLEERFKNEIPDLYNMIQSRNDYIYLYNINTFQIRLLSDILVQLTISTKTMTI
ncbi:hypothetical protein KSF78_0005304 [Schistosoma japonicum]|nr:hypothetical protein KSF78_0005304 [Schistosoma japonicum]